MLDGTNLTVGLRYTDEKRTERNASLNAVFGPFVFPTLYPNRESSEGKLTYRVSLDHRFSDAVMAYASVNTGFKSGGFNSTAPGEAPYLAERLTAFEAAARISAWASASEPISPGSTMTTRTSRSRSCSIIHCSS